MESRSSHEPELGKIVHSCARSLDDGRFGDPDRVLNREGTPVWYPDRRVPELEPSHLAWDKANESANYLLRAECYPAGALRYCGPDMR